MGPKTPEDLGAYFLLKFLNLSNASRMLIASHRDDVKMRSKDDLERFVKEGQQRIQWPNPPSLFRADPRLIG
jgi:hypothetical protein